MIPLPPTMLPIPRYTTHHYYVDIDNVYVAVFHECSGIGAEVGKEPVNEGGLNYLTRNLPKRVTCNPVTLKYGVVLVDEVWTWFEKALRGRPTRRDVVIHQFMNNGVFPGGLPQISWRLLDCLPIKYKGPDFSSKSDASVSLDQITVQPSSLERIVGPSSLVPAQMLGG